MAKKSYVDQYKDPRWQKKRLEIMERAGFKCEKCESSEKTLNVHHIIYESDKKVWDYSNHLLLCLCEDCHKIMHSFNNAIIYEISIYDFKEYFMVMNVLQLLKTITKEHPERIKSFFYEINTRDING